jgi:hypothetical protein
VFEKIGDFRKEFRISMDYDFFYRAVFSGCSISFGKSPIALMGGIGIGSNPKYLSERLHEDRRVQLLNEKSRFWKTAQWLFYLFYMPFKKKLMQKTAAS